MSHLTPAAGTPRLRLHIPSSDRPRALRAVREKPAPQESSLRATDPRWVLAVRAAELMQGPVLAPNDREQLLQTGRMMGLNPFQSNLVIAIVQDQARRGGSPQQAVKELAFIPPAQRPSTRHIWRVALIAAALVVAEAVLLTIFI